MSQNDVQAGKAVFALGDTEEARVIDMELPQPVIWWEEDGEQAAVIVQAEAHVGPDCELIEVLGLILPDGGGAVALLEDVDLVDDSDPVWRRLVTEAIGDGLPHVGEVPALRISSHQGSFLTIGVPRQHLRPGGQEATPTGRARSRRSGPADGCRAGHRPDTFRR